MTTVRLYGLTDGYGSYAQVLRGFEHAFSARGYGSRLTTISIEGRSDDAPAPNATADAGIFLGPPIACSALHQHASHKIRCVMLAPNSDRLPEPTMRVVNRHATHVLVPSFWAKAVVSAFTSLPVCVVPHGVDPGYRLTYHGLERPYEEGEFRVLHLSSSTRQRKGTFELLQAWRRLRKNHQLRRKSRLEVVVVPETRARIVEWIADEGETEENLGLVVRTRLGPDGLGASPELLREIYASYHVVCQPSRGEAFGMVPLEALACGTPIVATTATGHAEWFQPGLDGAVPIRTGELTDIDDLPGAQAPKLTVMAVADALEESYVNWHKLKAGAIAGAKHIAYEFSWVRQTEEFVKSLEETCRQKS